MDASTQKLWNQILHGIDALKLNLQLGETQQMFKKNMDVLTQSKYVRKTFSSIATEANEIVRKLDVLEKAGAIPRQGRWNDPITNESEQQNVLRAFEQIEFINFGGKQLKGKIDTGATTSSIHAENINTDKGSNRVKFVCPEISSNVITMDLVGAQEVHSADGGANARPIVAFDIVINGQRMHNVQFNLNDRSNMDVPVLIGQNVLKSGNFIVDVSNENVREAVLAASPAPELEQPTTIDQAKDAAQLILSYLNSADQAKPELPPGV